jgi:hypothetical protein
LGIHHLKNYLLFILLGILALMVLACEPLNTTMVPPTPEEPVEEEGIVEDTTTFLGADPVQLTTSSADDFDPAWEPRDWAIAFMKSKVGQGSPYDIGGVAPDGPSKRVMAFGPAQDIGIAGELSWVGTSGWLATNERIVFHEYMIFNTAFSPFNRDTKYDGDEAFTRVLKIPGGMGGDGFSVSRDGSRAMWKNRTSHNPDNSVISLRSAEFGALAGQSSAGFGDLLVTHSAAEDGPLFDQGFAMGPWGFSFAISQKTGSGFDIYTRSATDGEMESRLTDTCDGGAMNINPDISPDFKWVAFSSAPDADSHSDIYIVSDDGADLFQITNTPNISERWPTWSPDGLSLAYAATVHSAAAPNWDIYMISSE